MNNLSYKDAKELKDAGFPQEGDGDYELGEWENSICEDDQFRTRAKVYIPTLSELIEACEKMLGDEFCLSKFKDGKGNIVWQADNDPFISLIEDNKKVSSAEGETKEQAVKNLYMKLNERGRDFNNMCDRCKDVVEADKPYYVEGKPVSVHAGCPCKCHPESSR